MYGLILTAYILSGIVALLLIVFVIGQLLPSHYRATHTFTIPQRPEKAWAALHDYARNPLSGNMLKRMETLAGENDLSSWREHLGSTSILVTTTVSQPPHLVKRHMQDAMLPMSVDWQAHVEAIPEGSRITLASETILRRGTLHVPFFKVIMSLGGATMGLKAYAKLLQRNLDVGSK